MEIEEKIKGETITLAKMLKYGAGLIGGIVGIIAGISQLNSMIDSRIEKVLDSRFEHNIKVREKEIGGDAVKRFQQISKFVDTLQTIYPNLLVLVKDEDYRISGLYIEPRSKKRFYIDKDGIQRQVFINENGELTFFDGKVRIIQTP
jgi:hypothetical protein